MMVRTKELSLPKMKRLSDSRAFRALFSVKKKWSTPFFWVRVQEKEQSFPKLGLVLSKKKIPRAVDRNYLKRISREAFRHHQKDIPPWNYLFYFHQSCSREQGKKITTLLEEYFHRLA